MKAWLRKGALHDRSLKSGEANSTLSPGCRHSLNLTFALTPQLNVCNDMCASCFSRGVPKTFGIDLAHGIARGCCFACGVWLTAVWIALRHASRVASVDPANSTVSPLDVRTCRGHTERTIDHSQCIKNDAKVGSQVNHIKSPIYYPSVHT